MTPMMEEAGLAFTQRENISIGEVSKIQNLSPWVQAKSGCRLLTVLHTLAKRLPSLLPHLQGNEYYLLSLLLGSWYEQHHQYWLEEAPPLGWPLGQVLHRKRGSVAQSCRANIVMHSKAWD